MTEGYVITFLILLCLFYGKLCGTRNQLARIADFCERSEKRIKEQSERRA